MQKTTSLEMSKRLKEAGYPQQGRGFWYEIQSSGNIVCTYTNPEFQSKNCKYYKSIGTSELLEQLTNEEILRYLINSQIFFIDLFRDPDKLAECWIWINKRKGGVK